MRERGRITYLPREAGIGDVQRHFRNRTPGEGSDGVDQEAACHSQSREFVVNLCHEPAFIVTRRPWHYI
jgi:hypothetical protein